MEKEDDDDGEEDDRGGVQGEDADDDDDDDMGESDESEAYCSPGEDAISDGDTGIVVIKESMLVMLASSWFGGIVIAWEAET